VSPAADSSPTVRSVDEHDDVERALETYHRVESAAFGDPPDPSHRAAKRAMVDPSRWYLAELDGTACGGVGSFATELTVPGGATVPAGGVSDVGVLPTHRRRGVLSALLDRQLCDLAAGGEVAAVLHASEASIYRRFGFGPAVRWRQVAMDVRRAAYRGDWPDPGGSYRMVPREQAHASCAEVHDRVRRLRHGALARSEAWWQVVFGDVELYLGGGARRMVVQHLDAEGAPDGYAIYEVAQDWSSGQARHRLAVWELIGVSAAVELGLWRTMLDHDLVATVTGPVPVDHPLWDVVVDPRQVRTAWDQDLLWARILDVPSALSARTYGDVATLTIEVRQERGDDVAGTYRLDVEDEAAPGTCVRSDAAPDLSIEVADLGACWLGGWSFRRLVRAGRVHERSEGAAARADRMFATDPLPWCWVRF
jgi:predicted acetyltransferase